MSSEWHVGRTLALNTALHVSGRNVEAGSLYWEFAGTPGFPTTPHAPLKQMNSWRSLGWKGLYVFPDCWVLIRPINQRHNRSNAEYQFCYKTLSVKPPMEMTKVPKQNSSTRKPHINSKSSLPLAMSWPNNWPALVHEETLYADDAALCTYMRV